MNDCIVVLPKIDGHIFDGRRQKSFYEKLRAATDINQTFAIVDDSVDGELYRPVSAIAFLHLISRRKVVDVVDDIADMLKVLALILFPFFDEGQIEMKSPDGIRRLLNVGTGIGIALDEIGLAVGVDGDIPTHMMKFRNEFRHSYCNRADFIPMRISEAAKSFAAVGMFGNALMCFIDAVGDDLARNRINDDRTAAAMKIVDDIAAPSEATGSSHNSYRAMNVDQSVDANGVNGVGAEFG